MARLEAELTQARLQQEEAWKALEEERCLHEQSLLSERTAFDEALKKETGMRAAFETRIKALEDELTTTRGELNKAEADLNGTKTRIHPAVADYKNSPGFENYVDLRRQQWVFDFHQSEGLQNEIKLATIDGANRVLDKTQSSSSRVELPLRSKAHSSSPAATA